jgi:hypothetical protein
MSKFTLQHLVVEIHGFLSKTAKKDLSSPKNAEQRPNDFSHFVGDGPLAGEEDGAHNPLSVQIDRGKAGLRLVMQGRVPCPPPAQARARAAATRDDDCRRQDRSIPFSMSAIRQVAQSFGRACPSDLVCSPRVIVTGGRETRRRFRRGSVSLTRQRPARRARSRAARRGRSSVIARCLAVSRSCAARLLRHPLDCLGSKKAPAFVAADWISEPRGRRDCSRSCRDCTRQGPAGSDPRDARRDSLRLSSRQENTLEPSDRED